MKRYILVIWDDYYPSGGLGNIYDSYDDLDAARMVARAKRKAGHDDNIEIFDRDTLKSLEKF